MSSDSEDAAAAVSDNDSDDNFVSADATSDPGSSSDSSDSGDSSGSDDDSSASSAASTGARQRPAKRRRVANGDAQDKAGVLVHDVGTGRWWLFDPASTADADAVLAALVPALATPGECAPFFAAMDGTAPPPSSIASLAFGTWTRIQPLAAAKPLHVASVYVGDSRVHL